MTTVSLPPFTLTVAEALVLTGEPATLTGVGAAYSAQFEASGGFPPYTYSVEGDLPTPLAMNPETGALAADEIEEAGLFENIVARVTDSEGFTATRAAFNLLSAPALQIVAVPVTAAVQNGAYSFLVSVENAIGEADLNILDAAAGLSVTPLGDNEFEVEGPFASFGTFEMALHAEDEAERQTTLPFAVDVSIDIATLWPLGTEGPRWKARIDALWQDVDAVAAVTATGQQAGLSLSMERWGTDDFTAVMAARTEHRGNGTTGVVGTSDPATYNTATGEAVTPRGASVGNRSYVLFVDLQASTPHLIDIENTGSANVLIRSSIGGNNLFNVPAGQRLALILQTGTGGAFAFSSNENNTTASFTIHSLKRVPSYRGLQSVGNSRPTLVAETGGPLALSCDGTDDFYNSMVLPTSAGSIIFAGTITNASRVIGGSRAASDGFCYLGTNADGELCGAIGTQGFATIKAAGDIRNLFGVYALTWTGSEVSLWKNGALVYRAAQSGAVNTTIPIMTGALNNNGTAGSYAQMIAREIDVLNYVPSDEVMAALVSAPDFALAA